MEENQLFYEYFGDWFELFKKAEVKPVTARKYLEAQEAIKELAPNLRLNQMNRMQVQKLIVAYGKTHEIATAKGFFHMIRACLQNAQYDEIIPKDPTFKLKASSQKEHKVTRAKYLERKQAEYLSRVLRKDDSVPSDLFDFDMRTGLRFAELLGLTPEDINRENKTIKINKSWLYKNGSKADFGETKNIFSHREIKIDDFSLRLISKYSNKCSSNEPMFVKALSNEKGFKSTKKQKYASIYNSTMNRKLTKMCKEAHVPRIGIHGLRHTHASLMFNAGVSILSISKRLGHANTTTTEKVYVHLIQDQAEKDNRKMMSALNTLGEESDDSQ